MKLTTVISKTRTVKHEQFEAIHFRELEKADVCKLCPVLEDRYACNVSVTK